MFLIDIDEATLLEWQKEVNDSPKAKTFYERLSSDFEIYHSFDSNRQSILYESFCIKDGEYYCFVINNDREVLSLKGEKGDAFSLALALYLARLEQKMTPDQVRQVYQKNYDSILALAKMPREDALMRKKMLPLMNDLSKELMMSGEDSFEMNDKIDILYHVNKKEDMYQVRVKLGINHRYNFVRDIFDFVLAATQSGKVMLTKDKVFITPENIRDEDAKVVSLLSRSPSFANRSMLYSEENSELLLDEKGFVRFLFLLKGGVIHFEDAQFLISEEELTPQMKFDEEGNFFIEPELHGELICGEKKAILRLKERNQFVPVTFKSEKEMILSQFLLKNPNFPFRLFQNEICQNVLPVLNDEVEISKDFLSQHHVHKLEIQYYITYQEDDTLTFDTQYLVDENKVSKETFRMDSIGEKKYAQFASALEYFNLPENGQFISQEMILAFLRDDLYPLKKCSTLFLSENLAHKKVTGVGKLRVNLKSDIDWLDMDFGSDIYTSDEMEKILSAYQNKKKYVRLRDSFIAFDEEESKNFVRIVDDFSLSGLTEERIPVYEALKLSTYQSDEISVIYSKEIKELFDDIKNFKDTSLPISKKMEGKLRPYQLDGVKWLYTLSKHGLCGILADDMGLGKTLEIIALLSMAKTKKPILIVSPKSLIYNWENEFHKWNPSQKVFVFDGNKLSRSVLLSQIDSDKKEVYIISYDSLRNDLDEFEKHSFSYLILDEGQNIANVYAKKTKAVKEIVAEHKFVLTGTPIQNSLVDLWSIFDFLMPGYLSGFHSFSSTYGKITLDDPQEKANLMKKIAPFILKRTKKEVLLDLPNKEEQLVTILMNDSQREIYNAYIQNARASLDKGEDKITILAKITRLREICVDPSMFLEGFQGGSEKLNSTLNLISSAIENGHKILVFSCFVQTLNHLRDLLLSHEIKSYMISGDTSAKERLSMAEEFNTKDDISVMLVSLKAGGTGLNLIGADIVIHLDPWWNLAAEEQASDRAYRIGQKRNVTIMKLICKNTIEERVIELQQKKQSLTSIIQEGDLAIRNINLDDLRFLLS